MSSFLASISFAREGVKTALEIAKTLRAAESQIQTADLKLQLAEMMSALADAKSNIAEATDQMKEQMAEIDRLQNALRIKDDVVKHYDAYYTKAATGAPTGDPYCMQCWEFMFRLHHLSGLQHRMQCNVCKSSYEAHLAPRIHAPPA